MYTFANKTIVYESKHSRGVRFRGFIFIFSLSFGNLKIIKYEKKENKSTCGHWARIW